MTYCTDCNQPMAHVTGPLWVCVGCGGQAEEETPTVDEEAALNAARRIAEE